MAKTTKTRIYKVNQPDGTFALVEAASSRGAISHVVGKFFKAELATQHELVDAVKNGVEIETAGAEAEAQESIPGTEPGTQQGEEQPQG